jgi:hypothetical protein
MVLLDSPWLEHWQPLVKKMFSLILSQSAHEGPTKIAMKKPRSINLKDQNFTHCRNCTQGLGAFSLRLAPANMQEEKTLT